MIGEGAALGFTNFSIDTCPETLIFIETKDKKFVDLSISTKKHDTVRTHIITPLRMVGFNTPETRIPQVGSFICDLIPLFNEVFTPDKYPKSLSKDMVDKIKQTAKKIAESGLDLANEPDKPMAAVGARFDGNTYLLAFMFS